MSISCLSRFLELVLTNVVRGGVVCPLDYLPSRISQDARSSVRGEYHECVSKPVE